MINQLFIKGLLIGFLISAPIGPIAIISIRKTLQLGRAEGWCSGLGAAVADALYATIAALGLAFMTHILASLQIWLRLIGGGFLFYFGLNTFIAHPKENRGTVSRASLVSHFFYTFFLTIINPMTIGTFFALFAGLGLADLTHSYLEISVFIGGVFLGSTGWWFLLSEIIFLVRNRFKKETMRWINRIAGIILSGFGIATILTLLF